MRTLQHTSRGSHGEGEAWREVEREAVQLRDGLVTKHSPLVKHVASGSERA